MLKPKKSGKQTSSDHKALVYIILILMILAAFGGGLIAVFTAWNYGIN